MISFNTAEKNETNLITEVEYDFFHLSVSCFG